jgi:hypothetical protein
MLLAFAFNVAAECPTITLTPATLPYATMGVAYNTTITASGGTLPYTFDYTNGSLPPGFGLNTNSGVITGTCTNPGTYSFTVIATDRYGCTNARSYSLTINTQNCGSIEFTKDFNSMGTGTTLPAGSADPPVGSYDLGPAMEAANMAQVALVIATAALTRQESRVHVVARAHIDPDHQPYGLAGIECGHILRRRR